MSKYWDLTNNAPEIVVKENAKEVIFDLISVMCDNTAKIGFKKNSDGEFRMRTYGQSFRNFQVKGVDSTDLLWLADDLEWQAVVDGINTGTSVVASVRSR